MFWTIANNRLEFHAEDVSYYPSCKEIRSMLSGDNKCLPDGIPPLPDGFPLRISRLNASYRLLLDASAEQGIYITILAVRGENTCLICYATGKLQDYVIIEGAVHSLLTAYDSLFSCLKNAGIVASGSISLKQYMSLKQELKKNFSKYIFDDQAEKKLAAHPELPSPGAPAQMHASLYPYQMQGFRWLRFIASAGCGCILGDEMGLGKTLQIITLIADRRKSGHAPSLVVAPTSLLENWRREIVRFAGFLSVLIHSGARRTGIASGFSGYDVVVTSYGLANMDASLLRMCSWDLLILDEAQNIKNPSAERTVSIKSIPRAVGVAVTGTPFENHISDLWSLLDFAVPGCLGDLPSFKKNFSDDEIGARSLEPILTPLMLRRKVADVAKDLPERVDVPQTLVMDDAESARYDEIRKEILERCGENAALVELIQLRMYCTHPYLVGDIRDEPEKASQKYQRLCEIISEIRDYGEKIILFTSFNDMFDILEKDIPERLGIPVLLINGLTPPSNRQQIVDRFSHLNGCALLVLNPRAAGTGLNITAASRVIHYNLEWNPALEDQASARSYRRGQEKTVFVYRLYYSGTVEEVINERIIHKRQMADAAVIGSPGERDNRADIIRALELSPREERRGQPA